MFIFNHVGGAVCRRTLDLTTGTFHAHLVTQEPNRADTTVSNLFVATGGNYAPVALGNRQLVDVAPGVVGLDFNDPAWASPTNDNSPVVGVVVSKGSSAAGLVISYLAFSEPLYLNGAPLSPILPEGGVLKLDVRGAV